jgi:hypothetical protein
LHITLFVSCPGRTVRIFVAHIHSSSHSVSNRLRASFYCLLYRHSPVAFPLNAREQGFHCRPLCPKGNRRFFFVPRCLFSSTYSDPAHRVPCNAIVADRRDVPARPPRGAAPPYLLPLPHGSQITSASSLSAGRRGVLRKTTAFLGKRKGGMDETTLSPAQPSWPRENGTMTRGNKQRNAAHRHDVHMFF